MHRAATAAQATWIMIVFVAAWLFFMPTALGGQVTYAITSGNSMHPLLRSGDLAVLRRAEAVQVGDVVGYQGDRANALIIHRVVGLEGDVLTLKGDNNHWRDPARPNADAVVGSLWLRIPEMGKAVRTLSTPWIAGIAAAAIVGMTMLPWQRPKRRRQSGRPSQSLHSHNHPILLTLAGPKGMTFGGIVGSLAIALAGVAAVAMITPAHRVIMDGVPFQHEGEFEYSAPGHAQVYDDDLTTGDPIFVNLVPVVDHSFTYRFSSQSPAEVSGFITIVGFVSDVNGWNRSSEMNPRTPFEGATVSVTAQANLAETMVAIEASEELTGEAPHRYTAAVTAIVEVEGEVDGVPFESTFTPSVVYRAIPPNQFYIETPTSRILEGLNPGPGPENPFRPTESGVAVYERTVPNALALGPLSAPVVTVRFTAISLAILLGVAVGVQLTLITRARHASPLFRVLADHGHRLVALGGITRSELSGALPSARFPVDPSIDPTEGTPASDVTLVPVRTFRDLVSAADQIGKPILWESAAPSHVFQVRDGNVAYVLLLHDSTDAPA